jgi:hypothetical protein
MTNGSQTSPKDGTGVTDAELLLSVYQGMRSESLQHRSSILTSYGLAIAGLLAIGAGGLAPGKLPMNMKWLIAFIIVAVCISIWVFIKRQRAESEKAMAVMRQIEDHYRLFETGKYLVKKSVLPEEWCRWPSMPLGLTYGDWIHVGSLVLIGVGILLLLGFIPAA